MVALGLVAAVRFTGALFIAALAFAEPSLLAAAKLGHAGHGVRQSQRAVAVSGRKRRHHPSRFLRSALQRG
jgi:Na+/H+ antiporter NhaA